MLTRRDVMARLGVSRSQVRRYEEAGRLTPSRDAANVCWFEPSEVDALVRERANAVPLRGSAPFETQEDARLESAEREADVLAERKRELERRELALREHELAEREQEIAAREAERVRRERDELERAHEERCGEPRQMLLRMWRTRSLKSLYLLPESDLRLMLHVLVPMKPEELDAVPSYELSGRIERELRARATQVPPRFR